MARKHYPITYYQILTEISSSAEKLNNDNKCEKKYKFSKKRAKIRVVEKHSILFRKYTVTYYKTLEDVLWLLMLEKPKNRQKLLKNVKKMKVLLKNSLKFVILKNWKLFIAKKTFSVSNYQTFKDVFEPKLLEKNENEKEMSKKLKNSWC